MSQKNPAPLSSKSRAPKRDRIPYRPKEELLPAPDDYFRSASYIDQRAAMGEFKGAPGRETGTVAVLHYLWRHTLRDKGLERASDGRETFGCVLTGKSKLAKIAADTCLSYSTVQRAVDGLIREGWLEYDYRDDQTMILRVRMDMDGHHERLSLRGEGVVSQPTGVVSQTTGSEGVVRETTGGGQTDNGGVVRETTGGGQGDHTIQGFDRGFDRDFDSGNSVTTTEENHQNQGQNRGGEAPHTPEGPGGTSSVSVSLAPVSLAPVSSAPVSSAYETLGAEERAERESREFTEAERNEILADKIRATMPDYVPSGVHPRGDTRLHTHHGPSCNCLPVWVHEEFGVLFLGGPSYCPGPDWQASNISREGWHSVRDRLPVRLRAA